MTSEYEKQAGIAADGNFQLRVRMAMMHATSRSLANPTDSPGERALAMQVLGTANGRVRQVALALVTQGFTLDSTDEEILAGVEALGRAAAMAGA